MPVVFREGGLRYFFFSNEGQPREIPHVHVKGRGCDAKIWLQPEISIAESYGFKPVELRRILEVVTEHGTQILRAWYEHLPNGRAL
jgi:hypothetical protein